VLRPTSCKYPPAEPGALGTGPLKAAGLDPKHPLHGLGTKYIDMPAQPYYPTSPAALRKRISLDRCVTIWFSLRFSGVRHELPFVCVQAHEAGVSSIKTAANVKLLLPPRQSRGVSLLC
jgi:hypothetical protein